MNPLMTGRRPERPRVLAAAITVTALVALSPHLLGAQPVTLFPVWEVNGQVGGAVAFAGDVNGDGIDDVIVGEPTFNDGVSQVGRVRVYHGSISGLSTIPSWTANGSGGLFGTEVATAGDVNGDGFDDIVVAAVGIATVYVYHGGPGGLATSPAWSRTESADFGRFFIFGAAFVSPSLAFALPKGAFSRRRRSPSRCIAIA